MPRSFLLVLCLLVVACNKAKPDVVEAASSAPTPAVVASTVPDASMKAKKPSPRDVVDRWNEAHVKHDTRALESLYAARVVFYGQDLSSKECVKKKGDAFAKDATYTQAVRDVVASKYDAGATNLVVVRFTKTSTSKGKSTDFPSTLVLDGAGLIAGESDDITEANLATMASATAEWCTDNDPEVFDAYPTERVIAPYKLSAREVFLRAPDTKYFKDLVTANHGDFLVIDVIECPTKCDRAAKQCGYLMRVGNHGTNRFPFEVDWFYVDAVDGTVWYESQTKSEPLPPLRSLARP